MVKHIHFTSVVKNCKSHCVITYHITRFSFNHLLLFLLLSRLLSWFRTFRTLCSRWFCRPFGFGAPSPTRRQALFLWILLFLWFWYIFHSAALASFLIAHFTVCGFYHIPNKVAFETFFTVTCTAPFTHIRCIRGGTSPATHRSVVSHSNLDTETFPIHI